MALRPVTAEARVRARVSPCGICGVQSGSETVFSEFFGSPMSASFHHGCPPTCIIWGMSNSRVSARCSEIVFTQSILTTTGYLFSLGVINILSIRNKILNALHISL
jgi:hypothetical protein